MKIKIEANIDNSEEAKESMKRGIDGIGLYRSEYLFMNKKRMPSENEQYDSLKKPEISKRKAVRSIRTLDIGNDKKVPSSNSIEPKGNKIIVLHFQEFLEDKFQPILKTSKYGNVRIMLPMVSNIRSAETKINR